MIFASGLGKQPCIQLVLAVKAPQLFQHSFPEGEVPVSAIHSFCALRPPVEKVEQVASVPYDVVNTLEARAMASDNPFSFLRVSRPEIELPEGTDIYSDAVYARAADNFQKLINTCPLEVEGAPSLYLYRLKMGEHVQTGVACCVSVDEYDRGLIRKHEFTRPDKEDDRTRHMITLRAQTGPVFLTYRADRRIDALVAGETSGAPLYDFTAEDGVRHTVWRTRSPEQLARAFNEVPLLYIADGHHRAASAARARASLRAQNPNHTGDEEYNRFLAVVFPSDQMQILPYNRAVKDLNGMSREGFLAKVRERFDVTENANSRGPGKSGHWHMYLDKNWYGLTLKSGAPSTEGDPVAALDVSVLQDNLLDSVLGIKDVRTDKRIDFVGGIRGTQELEQLVDGGRAAVAFALHPTSIDDLLRVSDVNSIMPPKSTWFEPKLRDGILIHGI
ncbi:MAG: DUF1015 domain-containing protein [Pyrinomonadaceae bacterium]|nr:DUF1015 domain-containing protein [Pyrinomonadaceae bacterium]